MLDYQFSSFVYHITYMIYDTFHKTIEMFDTKNLKFSYGRILSKILVPILGKCILKQIFIPDEAHVFLAFCSLFVLCRRYIAAL